jgi:hypothetical protein
MSTRRKVPKPTGTSFTLAEQLMASPVHPLPVADAAERVRVAREHLERLQYAAEPAVMDWRVCAMVGNVIEVMLGMGLLRDDERVLANAQGVLRAASEHALANDVRPRLVGVEAEHVRALIDAFEQVLAEVPHRTMIRVFRETDVLMRRLNAGQRRPGDYVAKTGAGGARAA